MPYLIDGHNLIPKIPGMSLEHLDDEDQLILALQEFCRVRRQSVEVFFDNAPPEQAGRKTAGQVVVRWIRQGKTADQAILDRLERLGKGAKSWTVVSSDRQVRAGARERGARLVSAEEFAVLLQAARYESQASEKENLSKTAPDDIEEWLRIFKQK